MRLVLAILALALAAWAPAQAATNRPNVLFIIVDDLNDWVGFMRGEPGGGPPPGAGASFTPNIDALAARGVAFTRAYAAAPICTPSRTAMLGGRRPGYTGVYDLNHDWEAAYKARGIVPITKQFKANGYDVYGFGKVYHPQDTAYNSSLFTLFKAESGGGAGKYNLNGLNAGADDWGSPANADTDQETRDYRSTTDAIARINQPHARPFFIALGLTKPHIPLYVPPQYFDEFPSSLQPPTIDDDLADIPPPGQTLARKSGFQNGERLSFAQLVAAGKWGDYVQAYLAAIAFADRQIGRVMDALNASPDRDNTIVILVGDHGYHIGEKEHLHKAALWERTVRVPLIVAGPGIAPGRSTAPVDLMAVYPTLTDLTGIPAPASGQDGASLRPFLEDPSADPRKNPVAISTYWDGKGTAVHSIRSKRFRYTLYADGSEELYDETADPNEWVNQAANPAFATNKATLRKLIPAAPANNRAPVANFNGSSAD